MSDRGSTPVKGSGSDHPYSATKYLTSCHVASDELVPFPVATRMLVRTTRAVLDPVAVDDAVRVRTVVDVVVDDDEAAPVANRNETRTLAVDDEPMPAPVAVRGAVCRCVSDDEPVPAPVAVRTVFVMI